MRYLKELLFLKEISGIGNAKINKTYSDFLRSGCSYEELRDHVLQNEPKVDRIGVDTATDKSDKYSDMLSKASDFQIYTIMDPEYPEKLNALGNKRPVIIYVNGAKW